MSHCMFSSNEVCEVAAPRHAQGMERAFCRGTSYPHSRWGPLHDNLVCNFSLTSSQRENTLRASLQHWVHNTRKIPPETAPAQRSVSVIGMPTKPNLLLLCPYGKGLGLNAALVLWMWAAPALELCHPKKWHPNCSGALRSGGLVTQPVWGQHAGRQKWMLR